MVSTVDVAVPELTLAPAYQDQSSAVLASSAGKTSLGPSSVHDPVYRHSVWPLLLILSVFSLLGDYSLHYGHKELCGTTFPYISSITIQC